MKKFKILLSVLAIMLLITGCTSKTIDEDDGPLDGGWETSTSSTYKSGIPTDAKKVFDNATKDYTGLTLEAVGLLGTQTVSGINYMFIAKGTTVTAEPTTSWKIVTIYEDLNGKAEITSVEDFKYENYTNSDIQFEDKELVGGWTINTKETVVDLDKDVKNIYEAATEEWIGTELNPITYLGSQVVSGTNYAFLCLAKTVTKDPKYYISVVTIYRDLEANQNVTSISYVDLAELNN